MPLCGFLYIGYVYGKFMGVDIFYLTLKDHGQGPRPRSLGLVTRQIEYDGDKMFHFRADLH